MLARAPGIGKHKLKLAVTIKIGDAEGHEPAAADRFAYGENILTCNEVGLIRLSTLRDHENLDVKAVPDVRRSQFLRNGN